MILEVEIIDEAPLSVNFDDNDDALDINFSDSRILSGVSDVRVNHVSVVQNGIANINNMASQESLLEHTGNSDIHVTAALKMVISDSEIENL